MHFMKPLVIFISLLVGTQLAFAQKGKIAKTDLVYLQKLNDSLAKTGIAMLDDLSPANRLRADSLFTRQLVRGLIRPYSFYFAFDSLTFAPVLYAPDSSFRVITWHYSLNDADFRQKGVLQLNTKDGSAKFFPLFDVSDYTDEPQDSIRDHRNWIGAIYYNIVMHEVGGQKVYTLFGYDENNSVTTRKWMEILTFSPEGEPRFGGNFFRIPTNTGFGPQQKRFFLEYKTGARARLNFDKEEGLVIMDYLVSETNEPDKVYTLVPGGDYSGFKWNRDAWEYIPMLSTDVLTDGNEPRPALILSTDGYADEKVLQKQSEKNMKNAEDKNKPKTAVPKKGKTL